MTNPIPNPGPEVYQAQHRIRFVTAASLFDGHDASINIIRRLLQSSGAEVVHLGHNRSVHEVARAALQEDAQAIAVSSYQGGHMEYFQFLREVLNANGAHDVRVFAGGGGVIVPDEIRELESSGAVTRVFSPEDGRKLGLQGMINEMLRESDFAWQTPLDERGEFRSISRSITLLENTAQNEILEEAQAGPPVLGITGPGGAGKSSLTDELCLRLLGTNPDARLAVLAIDPTRRKTGGALLGDRIRMNTPELFPDRLFVRSMATRESGRSVAATARATLDLLKGAGFDLILVETSGTGQSDADVVELADLNLYVMTAEFGAPTQLEKIAMLDYADLVALNKSEKQGSFDALQYVRKQFQRNHTRFQEPVETMPVYPTVASRFNDSGVNALYHAIIQNLNQKGSSTWSSLKSPEASEGDSGIIPGGRVRYLAEIAETVRAYHARAERQARLAHDLQCVRKTRLLIQEQTHSPHPVAHDQTNDSRNSPDHGPMPALEQMENEIKSAMDADLLQWLEKWPEARARYSGDEYVYTIRGREIRTKLKSETLSGLKVSNVAVPRAEAWLELTRYYYRENLPGHFPFTGSVFPFRKVGEDPTRMFAGEGGPERTNRRFHYVTEGRAAEPDAIARLSTAFDSVTLYGEDPDERPDISGKVGNSGVSVPTLDDCKRLYSGFDLTSPGTSVSMTINGPAPMILAFFFNTAIDQQVEKHLHETQRLEEAREKIKELYRSRNIEAPEYKGDLPPGHSGLGLELLGMPGAMVVEEDVYERIKKDVLSKVRGTVQADILKEDQAQNTCIFSTAFALRMMGDVQEYFVENQIRNFYSVSISGYHIAEAGANPITQVAFTLANGLTYVEYYLKRGLSIDEFAPNMSFFFSNGLDAEYSVIGRVARRIWAVAMRERYQASERSQKLKYHIQTSGRSLHAREIDFNDIRTTLQALYALYDNCNSLHTNAYDEAITTPTEASVRRAMAIQMIIGKELGLNKNQNPLQGAYIIEELTDLVEEAVLSEFERISDRGGVLAAMETMYQRGKIQEESMHYEHLKHSGALPIIGVNTYVNDARTELETTELIRSTEDEKERQIARVRDLARVYEPESKAALQRLRDVALSGKNIFSELMHTTRFCSLGRISGLLYEVGGSYRRSM